MESLCGDLLLLAIDPASGVVWSWSRLNIALTGAELAQLQEAGRIEVSADRIVVTGPADAAVGQLVPGAEKGAASSTWTASAIR